MSKKIQVITEGGEIFGFGHITRCISLTQQFKNFDIEFIIQGDLTVFNILPIEITKLINWHENEKVLLENLFSDILLIDSLHIKKSLIKEIEVLNIPIILFDDQKRMNILNKGYVIDWTILSEEKNFFIPRKENVKYFLGAKYTSFRKPFMISEPSDLNIDIKKIFVSFGGSDVRNITPKVLHFLSNTYPNIKKDIIIGPGFNNIEDIKILKDDNTNILFNLNEYEMCNHMKNSDIAISAGGQTLYELARLGIPTISPLLVNNAKDDTFGWKEIGFIRYIGYYNDKNLLINLSREMKYLQSYEKRKESQDKALKYINLEKKSQIIKSVIEDLNETI